MFNDRCTTKEPPKEIVLAKLRSAPCFELQLDEMTDITSQAQSTVHIPLQDMESKKLAEHYLFCLSISMDSTASRIFLKVDNYLLDHEVMCSKCKAVSTDGARAMIGVCNGVAALIKQVALEVVNIHCIIHRKALVAKKLVNQERNCKLADVISIVTTILKNTKSNGAFHTLIKEMGDDGHLVYHSEVRWLSCGRVMERV